MGTNRLQRKVLLVVVLIVLLPMLITGSLSAAWITARINSAIADRLRQSAILDSETFARLHKNARLFANTLVQVDQDLAHLKQDGTAPIPQQLVSLAQELGITLIQVYSPNGDLIYSSPSAQLLSAIPAGQQSAVAGVRVNGRRILASINILHMVHGQDRLLLGTLLDRAFLAKLSRDSGLKIRLYYPHDGDFSNAFSEDEQLLKLQLPTMAYARLLNKQDYFNPDAEQGRYWGLYSPVIDTDGRVEAVLFTGELRAGSGRLLSDQGLLTLVIFLVGTVLAVATGLLLGRFIVRPVRQLYQGVLRVAAQDFRASLPVRTQDELGELAQAFNAMAESLRVARDEQHRDFQRDKLSALGELAMGMAHEIRNPVGTIMTASGLLQTTSDQDKQAQLREAIHVASQRLDQLLNDFQQLARHQAPTLRRLDPAEPLEKMLSQALIGCDEIKLKRNYRHENVSVAGDPDLLQQAWANLIRNALEAMAGNRGELEVGSVVETDSVLLYLQDSGPGIPLAQVPRLFEPFYTSKTQGSGLGLTIAASLVEACGGRLEFIPGTWRGARLAMRLPVIDSEDG